MLVVQVLSTPDTGDTIEEADTTEEYIKLDYYFTTPDSRLLFAQGGWFSRLCGVTRRYLLKLRC